MLGRDVDRGDIPVSLGFEERGARCHETAKYPHGPAVELREKCHLLIARELMPERRARAPLGVRPEAAIDAVMGVLPEQRDAERHHSVEIVCTSGTHEDA